MRKLFALALMALALASLAAGCGKKAEETPPAATESSTSDSTAMGGSMDSTSMMSADSTKH
jgi:predicted small lipoprotein YifL